MQKSFSVPQLSSKIYDDFMTHQQSPPNGQDSATHDDDLAFEHDPLLLSGSPSRDHIEYQRPFGDLDLPDAIVMYSLEFLQAKQVARLASVNRKFRTVSESRS
jgi:hypothetical protein